MTGSRRRNVLIALMLLSLSCFVNATAESQSEFDLLIANDTALFSVKIQDTTSQTFLNTNLPSNAKIIDIDYHRSRNLVFWIDSTTSRIQSRSLDHGNQQVRTVAEKIGAEWEPVALAVDYIGDVLYVVDVLGRKVEVYDLENVDRSAIVVAAGLDRPIDIALDPHAGLMFVVDNNRITRMNMDGSSSVPIIRKIIESAISSLTIDHITKTIYWWDSDLRIIVRSSYVGDSEKILYQSHGNEILTSLSFFDNQLYYLEKNSKRVSRIDVTVHNSPAEKLLDDFAGSSLRILRPSEHVDAFPCKVANCQHMCLLNSRSERKTCACPVNQVLKSDGNNCQRLDEFLLYSQKEVIKGRELEPIIGSSSPVVVTVAARRSHALSIDFDYVRRKVYFADANSKKIYASDIKTGAREEIASYEGLASIAVDWLAQNLYYTDFAAGNLCVASLRNFTNHKCLLDSLTGPKFVMTHPQKGQVYFFDDNKIKRINADGTKLTTIHTPLAHKVLGLAIDRSADRFYWLQTDSDKPEEFRIHNSDLEGWDERSVEAPLLRNCVGGGAFVVKNDWIYLVCDNYERLVRVNKSTGKQLAEMARSPDRQGFYALAVFAPQIPLTLQEQLQHPRHPCLNHNGHCTNFCFGVPWSQNRSADQEDSLMRVCACPEGHRLDQSQLCVSEVKSKPAHQVHVCESDWEFTCRNGRCIPKTQLCDGVNDCLDRSDERDCPGYRRDFLFGP